MSRIQAPREQDVAFGCPGGESCGPRKARPVDLAHLSRQTMGDRALEQEVLGLFVQQAMAVREQIGSADTASRLRLAHTLKGSARSVGAGPLASCAEAIESDPGNRGTIARLGPLIDELRDFVAAITR